MGTISAPLRGPVRGKAGIDPGVTAFAAVRGDRDFQLRAIDGLNQLRPLCATATPTPAACPVLTKTKTGQNNPDPPSPPTSRPCTRRASPHCSRAVTRKPSTCCAARSRSTHANHAPCRSRQCAPGSGPIQDAAAAIARRSRRRQMAEAHNNLGDALRALDRPRRGNPVIAARWRSRRLTSTRNWISASSCLRRLGSTKPAPVSSAAVAAHPGSWRSTQSSRQRAPAPRARDAEAVTRYERALALGFRDPETLNGLGNALHGLMSTDDCRGALPRGDRAQSGFRRGS